MWWLLVTITAMGGVPEGVRPTLAPPDVPEQYATWLEEQGGEADELACTPFWPDEALLCFKLRDEERVRWVTAADLARWGVEVKELRRNVAKAARDRVEEGLERVPVSDMDAHYWVASGEEGWTAAPLLHPDRLAAQVGGAPFLLAAPTDDTLLVWNPGDPELDQVMAVGVRRMFEEEDGSVSSMVFQWTGEKWRPFGEAVPKEPGDGTPATPPE